MPSAQFFILVSLQRSGTTWFVEEMAKSPCVHAEHEIFSAYETHADADRWTTPGRRAAIDGLMRLAAGTWEKYDAPVPKKLVDFTRHKRDIMNKHNSTRAPIAMGMKWMAGYASGGGNNRRRDALVIRDNQGLEKSLDWLLPLARKKNIKFVFLERGHLLRRAVSSAPAQKSTSESKAP